MSRTLFFSVVFVLVFGECRTDAKQNLPESEFKHRLLVRVYDYALVPPEFIAEAKAVAGSIFRRVGVEIVWSDHSFNGGSPAVPTSDLGLTKLQLRILNRQMAERLPSNKSMTGLAFQGTGAEGGKVANVFYHRVEELASQGICSKGEILGHAAAHELGHLLLGNVEHSSSGLMKAKLGQKDLQKAAKGDLVFAANEGVRIRLALAEPPATQ